MTAVADILYFPLMQIHRHSLLAGAAECRDTAVIVDVFRAFTCASILLHYGVGRLLLAEDPETALKLKKDKDYLALGEIGGKMVEGFDFGNSPSEITSAGAEFFRAKNVVQRTSAGVRGIFAALGHCGTVYAAGFTTAAALARLIRRENHAEVHIAAMGQDATSVTPEDEQCAAYIQHLLKPGSPYDHPAALHEILSHESARKFLRGDKAHFPPPDVTWCLQRDLFPFAMKVHTAEDGPELRKADVS